MLNQLESLSINEIDKQLYSYKNKENLVIAEIIKLLSELDFRKAYRALGYSSLFMYCRERLGYSEAASYRRVQAARVLKTNPEIYGKLKDGKLTLSAIAEIAKIKESEVKAEALISSEGKSTREVQIITAPFLPAEKTKKESIRAKVVKAETPLNLSITSAAEVKDGYRRDKEIQEIKPVEMKYNFSMEVDEEFMNLYREAKEIIGHIPAAEIFKKTLSEFVNKRKTLKRKVALSAPSNSRFIPKATKLKVIKRDNRQCCFISPDGRRCSEKHGLEFDHIKPYAKGGDNSENNIRLLCKAHNQLHAEKCFGKEKIHSYLKLTA